MFQRYRKDRVDIHNALQARVSVVSCLSSEGHDGEKPPKIIRFPSNGIGLSSGFIRGSSITRFIAASRVTLSGHSTQEKTTASPSSACTALRKSVGMRVAPCSRNSASTAAASVRGHGRRVADGGWRIGHRAPDPARPARAHARHPRRPLTGTVLIRIWRGQRRGTASWLRPPSPEVFSGQAPRSYPLRFAFPRESNSVESGLFEPGCLGVPRSTRTAFLGLRAGAPVSQQGRIEVQQRGGVVEHLPAGIRGFTRTGELHHPGVVGAGCRPAVAGGVGTFS